VAEVKRSSGLGFHSRLGMRGGGASPDARERGEKKGRGQKNFAWLTFGGGWDTPRSTNVCLHPEEPKREAWLGAEDPKKRGRTGCQQAWWEVRSAKRRQPGKKG